MAADDKASSGDPMSVVHKAVAGVFVTVMAPVLVAFGVKFSDTLLTGKPEADKTAVTAPATNAPSPVAVTPLVVSAPATPAPPTVSPTATAPASAPAAAVRTISTVPLAAASSAPPAVSSGSSSSRPQAGANEEAGLHFPHFKRPTTPVVRLFNGRDLTGFYTYLGRRQSKGKLLGKNHDPAKVFSVNGGQLFVSGEILGTLETVKEYEDYWLTLEYKWGERTWPPRAEAARHSAVLVNIDGPDGVVRSVFPAAVHCQIIEGATGNLLLAAGPGEHNLSLTVAAEPHEVGHGAKRHTAFFYKPGQPLTTLSDGLVERYPPAVGWEDVKGFHPPGDVEQPHGQWNTLDIVSLDGKLLVQLNGQVVNFALHAEPSKGRIGIQSNGAEIIFRTISLQPYRRGSKRPEQHTSTPRKARAAPAGLESRPVGDE